MIMTCNLSKDMRFRVSEFTKGDDGIYKVYLKDLITTCPDGFLHSSKLILRNNESIKIPILYYSKEDKAPVLLIPIKSVPVTPIASVNHKLKFEERKDDGMFWTGFWIVSIIVLVLIISCGIYFGSRVNAEYSPNKKTKNPKRCEYCGGTFDFHGKCNACGNRSKEPMMSSYEEDDVRLASETPVTRYASNTTIINNNNSSSDLAAGIVLGSMLSSHVHAEHIHEREIIHEKDDCDRGYFSSDDSSDSGFFSSDDSSSFSLDDSSNSFGSD